MIPKYVYYIVENFAEQKLEGNKLPVSIYQEKNSDFDLEV